MTDEDLAWAADDACMAACPTPDPMILRDWELRAAGGTIRRINSVCPLRATSHDVMPVLPAIEAFYAGHGQQALFRVPSMVAGVDRPLDALGYTREGDSLTLAAGALTQGDFAGVEVTPLTPEWLETWKRIGGRADQVAIFTAMLNAIRVPKAFAAARVDGRLVSVAYAGVHAGLAAMEAVATDPDYRGRGLAKATVGALMAWGRTRGATGACLNVAADNPPALKVYAALGFTVEANRYHYRRAPAA